MCALLRSLATPRKLTESSSEDIAEIMGGGSFDAKPIIIAKRYKFHKCVQEERESVREFLAKLQKWAKIDA